MITMLTVSILSVAIATTWACEKLARMARPAEAGAQPTR
jgi:hypothetical protein